MSCGDIFLGLIAIIFPPVAVWIKRGLCSADSLINILLCMLGFVPGLIHAWYIIARYPEPDHDYDNLGAAESGRRGQRVTYYYVSHESDSARQGIQPARHARGYGTQGTPGAQPNKSVTATKWQGRGTGPQQGGTVAVAGSSSQPQQPVAGPSVGAGTHEEGAPPSYSDVVKGDNKIQSRD